MSGTLLFQSLRAGARRLLLVAAFGASAVAAEPLAARLAEAGNAADEAVRLAALRAMVDDGTVDSATRRQIASLLPVVEAWVLGRERAEKEIRKGRRETHRYLHRFFEDETEDFDPPFPVPPPADSPVYPLWAYYRGRFLAWFMIEDSGVSTVPKRMVRYVTEADRCFEVARRAFPENPVIRIYCGENQPIAGLSAWDQRAPAWANHERRALEQLHRIILWWITERQLSNGEYGGKWGDDVEMWRWWAPVLIGFDDPVVNAAEEKLARGNLGRPGMSAGYTDHLTDVEHTAEETADTLTPMLHVAPGDPDWDRRVRRLIELAQKVWWGKNDRGQVQFKHVDFNASRVGRDRGRAYDTGYHTRVMQPALLLWQRTGDLALGAPLTAWLRTWAEAALSDDNGKPKGIVPASLQWPTGRVGSAERGWIGPNLVGDPMMGIYSWPGYPVSAMTSCLLQAHTQTGDPLFLEPLVRMAEMRRAHLKAGARDGEPGTPEWAAHRLPRIINDALAKWRQLTGDPRFDDLLRSDASGYVRRILDGDTKRLAEELGATAATLSANWPMHTSEVRYTDRVLSFPHSWPRTVASGLSRIDSDLVYSCVTGDPGSVLNFPLNGARWHTLPREFAVLVTRNHRDDFAAELFHFGGDRRALAVTLLSLQAGTYVWRLESAEGGELSRGEITISTTQRRMEFTLPAGVLCTLSVSRRARRRPTRRPDSLCRI